MSRVWRTGAERRGRDFPGERSERENLGKGVGTEHVIKENFFFNIYLLYLVLVMRENGLPKDTSALRDDFSV